MAMDDKQRRAMFAKMKNQPRAETRPSVVGRIRGRLRKRFRPTADELAVQRGARLEREAESLAQERRRVRQLELESRVESEREAVRQRETEARRKLSEIDRARRERTIAGRLVTRGRQLARTGAERLAQPAPRPRSRKRRARPEPEDTGFFGIS